jgi:hypothetical protein
MTRLESQPGTRPPERRKEGRTEVQAAVQLFVDDPEPQAIPAFLLDLSKNGFRARYRRASLSSGSEIRFLHKRARGKARVMWSCVLPDVIESGFLILR